jgi:SAM-dependent methyltransferase
MERPNLKDKSVKDVWELGDAYEVFMGRWSRLVAKEFLHWLSVPSGGKWLDVGCGTGVLTQSILEHADPVLVRGVDQAPGFISFAGSRVRDSRVTFGAVPSDSLDLPPGMFDAVVSGLVLNFIPNPDQALSAMMRSAAPGGVVAAYVWDYADGMQMLRQFWDATVSLDRNAAALDEGKRFPLCGPDRLRDVFATGGLKNVDVRSIEVQTQFADFDDYWSPFLSGQGPAPSYVASLSPDRQESLRELLRSKLSSTSKGRISLTARAWAVKGHRQ